MYIHIDIYMYICLYTHIERSMCQYTYVNLSRCQHMYQYRDIHPAGREEGLLAGVHAAAAGAGTWTCTSGDLDLRVGICVGIDLYIY